MSADGLRNFAVSHISNHLSNDNTDKDKQRSTQQEHDDRSQPEERAAQRPGQPAHPKDICMGTVLDRDNVALSSKNGTDKEERPLIEAPKSSTKSRRTTRVRKSVKLDRALDLQEGLVQASHASTDNQPESIPSRRGPKAARKEPDYMPYFESTSDVVPLTLPRNYHSVDHHISIHDKNDADYRETSRFRTLELVVLDVDHARLTLPKIVQNIFDERLRHMPDATIPDVSFDTPQAPESLSEEASLDYGYIRCQNAELLLQWRQWLRSAKHDAICRPSNGRDRSREVRANVQHLGPFLDQTKQRIEDAIRKKFPEMFPSGKIESYTTFANGRIPAFHTLVLKKRADVERICRLRWMVNGREIIFERPAAIVPEHPYEMWMRLSPHCDQWDVKQYFAALLDWIVRSQSTIIFRDDSGSTMPNRYNYLFADGMTMLELHQVLDQDTFEEAFTVDEFGTCYYILRPSKLGAVQLMMKFFRYNEIDDQCGRLELLFNANIRKTFAADVVQLDFISQTLLTHRIDTAALLRDNQQIAEAQRFISAQQKASESQRNESIETTLEQVVVVLGAINRQWAIAEGPGLIQRLINIEIAVGQMKLEGA